MGEQSKEFLLTLYMLNYFKFSIFNMLHLFQRCYVFAHRVTKMSLCRMHKDAKTFSSAQLCKRAM